MPKKPPLSKKLIFSSSSDLSMFILRAICPYCCSFCMYFTTSNFQYPLFLFPTFLSHFFPLFLTTVLVVFPPNEISFPRGNFFPIHICIHFLISLNLYPVTRLLRQYSFVWKGFSIHNEITKNQEKQLRSAILTVLQTSSKNCQLSCSGKNLANLRREYRVDL